jgi:hypothetical protein
MSRKTWRKHISVDRRIVRLLSASTYEDFPGALKEMVSNAYDADATAVDIRIDLENEVITITDDGNGMTPSEFDFFLRIAGQRRGRRISPEFGRRRIGQFGIGFMAIFPFGKRIQVVSTARRSDKWFEAIISTERFIQASQEGLSINVEDIEIPGQEVRELRFLGEHGTTIRISGLTEMVKRYFQDRDIPIRGRRQTIRSWSPMNQLEWMLKEDLPLDYPPDSPFDEAFIDLSPLGFKVLLNDQKLLRNVHASHVLENASWEFNEVRCRYVIASHWKSIVPNESRYLKLRLRNVGIGKRTPFGLGTEGRTYSRLHWLTGEIHVLDGFDNLITIDRKRFLESAEYDQFQEFFRSRLAHFAHYVEDVSVAELKIKRQLTGSRVAEVGSRREIIGRNISTLESKGFEVVSKSANDSLDETEPVVVDVKRKIVEIIENHPAFSDTISIGSEQISIRYTEWTKSKREFPAVRRARDGIIEINTSYPLFESRRYGEVFKKVLVLMLMLSETTNSPGALFSEVARQLQKEFRDLT